jgi:quinol monooxygenase YgiN
MVTVGLLVRLMAKPGKEAELTELLQQALSLVENEPATTAWFAVRFTQASFGIFDVFPDDAGRRAHLVGRVASALQSRAADLLSESPVIEEIDVVASKLPQLMRPV